MISKDSPQSNTSDKKVNSNYNFNSSTKHKRKESKMNQVNIEKFTPRQDDDDYEGMIKEEGHPFCLIPNNVSQGLTNATALGIWVYFQSLPPDWIIRKKHVMERFGIGEKSHRAIMSLLHRCHLIGYKQTRDENGYFLPNKVIVRNGKDFVVDQQNVENINDFKGLTAGAKTTPPVKNESIGRGNLRPCRKRDVPISTPLTKNIDLIKEIDHKKTTTTKATPESSSSFINISPLREYGFTDHHKDQMDKLDLSNDEIQQSILAYAQALKDISYRSKRKNIVSYLMGILRRGDVFTYSSSPIVKDPKVIKARQEASQRLIDALIDAPVDPKYGDLSKCSKVPNS